MTDHDADAALAHLSGLATVGRAWRSLRAAGETPQAAAAWLTTPNADLDGLAPEVAAFTMPERVRAVVARHIGP